MIDTSIFSPDRDYATEKIFNILQYGIIPVVYGGANYSAILPPKSYIDATHQHPKRLAATLLAIANNEDEYGSYFQWKKYYYVRRWIAANDYLFCSLCKRMAEQKQGKHSHKSWSPERINQWFSADKTCFKPKFHFEKSIFS